MKLHTAALMAVLSLGVGLTTACQKKEESTMEKAADALGDATNTRDNENMKDAGEDAADAIENAKEGVKDAVDAE